MVRYQEEHQNETETFGSTGNRNRSSLLSVGFLDVEPGYAAERKCSLATLKGQYLVAATGTLFPPAFGVKKRSVSAAAGYSIYNGDGTGTDYVTFAVNGVNQNVASPTSTSYTLELRLHWNQNGLTVRPTFQYLRCVRRRGSDRHRDGFGIRSVRVRWASGLVSLKEQRRFSHLHELGLDHRAAVGQPR